MLKDIYSVQTNHINIDAHCEHLLEKLDADKDGKVSINDLERSILKVFTMVPDEKDNSRTPTHVPITQSHTHRSQRMPNGIQHRRAESYILPEGSSSHRSLNTDRNTHLTAQQSSNINVPLSGQADSVNRSNNRAYTNQSKNAPQTQSRASDSNVKNHQFSTQSYSMSNSLLEYVDKIDEKKQAKFQKSIENRQLKNTNFERLDRYLKKGRLIFKKFDFKDIGEIDLEQDYLAISLANEVEHLLYGGDEPLTDLNTRTESELQALKRFIRSMDSTGDNRVTLQEFENFLLLNLDNN